MQNVYGFFDVKKTSGVVIAVLLSILLVALITYGATTISTNVNTGGTLDVSGVTTLTGAASLNGSTTIDDILTVSGVATFSSRGQFNDVLRATSTFFATGASFFYSGVTLGDSGADVITITGNASTTNMFQVGGEFYAIGSTTLSNTLTVGGATTFTGIPTFRSAVRASSTADFTGAFATYGATTLGDAATDVITITGNASTTNSLTVVKDFFVDGTASTTKLLVGNGSSALTGLLTGYCSVNPGVDVVASSTQAVTCSGATGVRVGDRVFVMPTSTPPGQYAGLRISAASSTATDVIGLEITHATGTAASFTAQSLNFWVAR